MRQRAHRRTAVLGCVGLAVLSVAGVGQGQLARRGGEFLINTVTDGDQRGSRIAVLPDGGFVVVWQSNGNVAARRFDAETRPLGPEFQVNSTTPGRGPAPSVAAAPDGSMLVAWESVTGEPVANGIVAQRFNSRGEPDGPQFDITEPPFAIGFEPSVGAVGDQDFLVAWTEKYSYRGRARIVTPSGNGPSFYVADEGNQYDLASASTGDGSFRVVWYDEPGGQAEMQGRAFRNSEPTSDVFRIDGVSSGFHDGPAICTLEGDGFVVAWVTYVFDDSGTTRPVTYRQYDATGVPITPLLRATPKEAEPQQGRPSLACGPERDFVIAWGEAPGLYSSIFNVRGRVFTPDGPLPVSDFTIGHRDGGDGDGASVARLTDGDLLVTWTDCGLPSGCDVFGQRFTFAGRAPVPATAIGTAT